MNRRGFFGELFGAAAGLRILPAVQAIAPVPPVSHPPLADPEVMLTVRTFQRGFLLPNELLADMAAFEPSRQWMEAQVRKDMSFDTF